MHYDNIHMYYTCEISNATQAALATAQTRPVTACTLNALLSNANNSHYSKTNHKSLNVMPVVCTVFESLLAQPCRLPMSKSFFVKGSRCFISYLVLCFYFYSYHIWCSVLLLVG